MRPALSIVMPLLVATFVSEAHCQDLSRREYAVLKFQEGMSDIKRCEALMSDGYDEEQWQDCYNGSVRTDAKARDLGQEFEGARYQIERGDLVPGYVPSLVPGMYFLNDFGSLSDHALKVECEVLHIDFKNARALIERTARALNLPKSGTSPHN